MKKTISKEEKKGKDVRPRDEKGRYIKFPEVKGSLRKKKVVEQPPTKKRRMDRTPQQGHEEEEDLAMEIILDVTDTRKSFYWNHEEGADSVKLTRKVKRGAEVTWINLDDDGKTRFEEAKSKRS